MPRKRDEYLHVYRPHPDSDRPVLGRVRVRADLIEDTREATYSLCLSETREEVLKRLDELAEGLTEVTYEFTIVEEYNTEEICISASGWRPQTNEERTMIAAARAGTTPMAVQEAEREEARAQLEDIKARFPDLI